MELHQLCGGAGENGEDDERRKCDDSLREQRAGRVERMGPAIFRKEYAGDETASQEEHHPNWQWNAKICAGRTFFGRTFLRVGRHGPLSFKWKFAGSFESSSWDSL